jgi:hypothetical protein
MSDATSINSAWDQRRWLTLGVIGIAQLMIVLDVTVMGGVLLRRGPLGQKRTPSPASGAVTMAQAGASPERVRDRASKGRSARRGGTLRLARTARKGAAGGE